MPLTRPVSEARELLAAQRVIKPPIDVEEIARSLGLKVVRQPFDGNLSGMLQRQDGGAVVGVNSLHSKVRQRFTIAHEIGHFVLHRGRTFIDEVRVDYRDERASAGTYRQEINANSFVAELLMPADMVRNAVTHLLDSGLDASESEFVAVLADEFRVSSEAMSHRLTNLAFILQL